MVPPTYLLDLLGETRGSVKAEVYTSASWVRRLRNNSDFIKSGSSVANWVPADKLPALYEGCDCLLSIGELPGKQLSSKIFGYMASGKPIIHIFHTDDDANLPYLAEYPLALTIKDDESELPQNAANLCRFLLWAKGKELCFETVSDAMHKCTPEAVYLELVK